MCVSVRVCMRGVYVCVRVCVCTQQHTHVHICWLGVGDLFVCVRKHLCFCLRV